MMRIAESNAWGGAALAIVQTGARVAVPFGCGCRLQTGNQGPVKEFSEAKAVRRPNTDACVKHIVHYAVDRDKGDR
jgi:hypothetical protein